jgi:hypothetical protein
MTGAKRSKGKELLSFLLLSSAIIGSAIGAILFLDKQYYSTQKKAPLIEEVSHPESNQNVSGQQFYKADLSNQIPASGKPPVPSTQFQNSEATQTSSQSDTNKRKSTNPTNLDEKQTITPKIEKETQQAKKPAVESSQDDNNIIKVKRGDEVEISTFNFYNDNNSSFAIFSETGISEKVTGYVTYGTNGPETVKFDQPVFTGPLGHSNNATIYVDPSYEGGLSLFPGESGKFHIVLKVAPKAKLDEYQAVVRFLGGEVRFDGEVGQKVLIKEVTIPFKIVQ